ncbi:MAG: hypothetical protein J0H53_16670 [Rhizobiales bacterium]|jgi:hypothetical protein|nr:hypothetical protein [Hyphomicrobiales bacterium]OJU37600.1 MAG: hypothetical protein BGN94_22985 [Rhizobiales bacterium 68-8]
MRRGGRARARSEAGPEAVPATEVAWADLSEAERTALKRMNRGPYAALAQELGQRLVGLGLAVARPDGVGISRAGRELVINALLDARRDDAAP